MHTTDFYCLGLASPLGTWLLTTTDTQAVALDYIADADLPARIRYDAETKLEKRLECMLSRYFQGEMIDFSRIPVALPESVFLAEVMTTLRTVPYGEVRSYQWLAEAMNKPRATRAVGGALGRNPLPIIVPCHRIIAKDGSLGGFMRGKPEGTRLKEGLLGLEGSLKPKSFPEKENRLPLGC